MIDKIDDELMKKIRDKDSSAYQLLLLKYDKLLYNIAYDILKDEMLACDAIMETFKQLLVKSKTIRNVKCLKSWLCVTIRRIALNVLKKNKRIYYMDTDELEYIMDESCATNDDRIEKMHIQDCLSRLPPEQFEVLMLEYEGRKLYEISQLMSISMGRVRTLLKKAKINFKNLYENQQK